MKKSVVLLAVMMTGVLGFSAVAGAAEAENEAAVEAASQLEEVEEGLEEVEGELKEAGEKMEEAAQELDEKVEEAAQELDEKVEEAAQVLADAAGGAAGGYAYEDDDMKLVQYKGLTYSAVPYEVTDEEVDAEIEETLHAYAENEQVMEGTAQEGDEVNIDFVGTVDGEKFDGGSGEDYDLTIGSGYFLEEFENGIIGMEVGETKDVPVTFPEDYHAENLAGKEAVFAITLNYLAGEEIVPELTDAWVAENLGEDSIEAYRATVREDLEMEAEDSFEEEKKQEVLEKLVDGSEVTNIDKEKIENDVQSMVDYYTSYAQMWGMEYADFVKAMGYEEDTMLAQFTTEAEKFEKQRALLAKIAELESIELTDEEFDDEMTVLADQYGFETLDEFKKEIEEHGEEGADPYEAYREQFVLDKVTSFLVENAVFAEVEQVDESEELEPVSEDAGEAGTEAAAEAETEASAEAATEAAAQAATEAAAQDTTAAQE